LKVVNISLYTFEEGENVKVVGLTKIKGCLLKILSYSSTTRAGSIADLHNMTNEGLHCIKTVSDFYSIWITYNSA